MRGSIKVVLTLKDEGFKQCLKGGTACSKTKNKRNRIKEMRKIAYAQTSPSSDESSTNISLLEPSWIKEEESGKEDEEETHETKAEEGVVTLICSKCKCEHQLEASQFSDIREGGFDEENFCCEMFNRSCFSDASSESDYELFERSSEEDENNFATEGVDKEFPLFVPKYIEDWIQKAKDCDWNESEFVQWLKDFDEINDNFAHQFAHFRGHMAYLLHLQLRTHPMKSWKLEKKTLALGSC